MIGELFVMLVVLVVVLLFFVRVAQVERKIEQLRERVDRMGTAPPPAPQAPPEPAAPLPPLPVEPEPVTVAAPLTAPEPQTPPPARKLDIEQLIGGVWLQNAGAVLLLVGFFFLIVWGYATGRFGPEVLVIAGVLAGLGLVWRGAVMRRSVRGVGHALIGVGAGVVWLAVYLGHFRLGVLSTVPAFMAIAAASIFTGALGARYRVQLIAALGVLGAHLPNLMNLLVPDHAFHLPAAALLGYVVGINAIVLALALRAAWNALTLASLILTACTWALAVPGVWWSWPVEIGLAALFAVLGIAPVAQMLNPERRVRLVDIAVVAVAPLALLAASAPMFERADPVHVAILMFALAAVYVGVAAWVDARRPERDVWRPLVAAAILFATIAIERLLGPEQTAMAWTLEGTLLVWLGLRPRGEWLRWCGLAVVALGGVLLLSTLTTGMRVPPLPVVNATAIATGIALLAMFLTLGRLLRNEGRLSALERAVTYLWMAGANALLMIWIAREASHLAYALEHDGGVWRGERDIRASTSDRRYLAFNITLMGLVWMAQAAWLLWSGLRTQRLIQRALGYVVMLIAALVAFAAVYEGRSWGRDLLPLVHRDALIGLVTFGVLAAMARELALRRQELAPIEKHASKVLAAFASIILLTWIASEADHLARLITDVPGRAAEGWNQVGAAARNHVRAIAGTITSVGWILQALAAFTIGWTMRSPFMRWMGLVLVGFTVLKFLFVDLSNADPFWRFLTAILAGAAMLGLSYLYQRRRRESSG